MMLSVEGIVLLTVAGLFIFGLLSLCRAIRRYVEFSTPYFKVIRKKDGKLIPGLSIGKLSRYLAKALAAKGTTVQGVIAEESGSRLMIHYWTFPSMLWILCYNVDNPPTRWAVLLKAEYVLIGRLFGVNPKKEVATIEAQLREIIANIPEVSAIQWK